ncbi:MAG TPA: 16S rRNA (cytidine(1402)-2'-O)-methyltransferase, partial [Ruminococcaceae bacterium]|nr:16S rRNA (cytidine(1402)-2'-O)-methyltransferase [Oscillospiraceae bacterium]
PTALASALAISGLSTSRFTFEGFLSVNKPSRREHLSSLLQETRTMVFYEAPHKLPATLKDMYRFFGDRRISIVKELTKVHEEVIRTTLKEAAEKYTDEKSIKGEIVLIVEGTADVRKENSTLEEAVAIAEELLETGLSAAEAAKESAKLTGLKKGDIYKSLLNKK